MTSSKIKYSKMVHAFTEQGVAMLSSVLNSERAIEVNIEIMRAFVRLREMLSSHKDLERKLIALEKKYDEQFKVVFDAIRALMKETEKPKRKIYPVKLVSVRPYCNKSTPRQKERIFMNRGFV